LKCEENPASTSFHSSRVGACITRPASGGGSASRSSVMRRQEYPSAGSIADRRLLETGAEPIRVGLRRLRDEWSLLVTVASLLVRVADIGISGKARPVDDWTERARKTVRLRVANALKRIEAVNHPLGAHLRAAIRTGAYCSYT
jgi:hypothetical protein